MAKDTNKCHETQAQSPEDGWKGRGEAPSTHTEPFLLLRFNFNFEELIEHSY